jgi:hypothetical protein
MSDDPRRLNETMGGLAQLAFSTKDLIPIDPEFSFQF